MEIRPIYYYYNISILMSQMILYFIVILTMAFSLLFEESPVRILMRTISTSAK